MEHMQNNDPDSCYRLCHQTNLESSNDVANSTENCANTPIGTTSSTNCDRDGYGENLLGTSPGSKRIELWPWLCTHYLCDLDKAIFLKFDFGLSFFNKNLLEQYYL